MHSRAMLVACMALTGAASLTVRAQPGESGPLARLELMLTTAPTLPDAARLALMDQAAAIWRSQGIAIDWLPATAVRTPSPRRLRVLIVDRRLPSAGRGDAFTVGELVRPPTGHAIAMMSIESAQRLLASVRGRAGYDLIAVDEQRLGLVLGRALAHEIGHYLLQTHTHARDGLMRPQFNALEFTDRRDQTFALDQTASDWLKSRLDLSTTSDAAKHARFAYAQ